MHLGQPIFRMDRFHMSLLFVTVNQGYKRLSALGEQTSIWLNILVDMAFPMVISLFL